MSFFNSNMLVEIQPTDEEPYSLVGLIKTLSILPVCIGIAVMFRTTPCAIFFSLIQ
jgi:hypothetical protein